MGAPQKADSSSYQFPVKKWKAAVIAVGLTCLAYGIVVALTDQPFPDIRIPPGKEHRAALAIRDRVERSPFVRWLSRQFVWPYQARYYGAAWYFPQTDADDCKQAFQACLDKALQQYSDVDLYLLAHSNRFIDWVAELPAEHRRHLRLVYNQGCYDLPQGPEWVRLGAKAYVGHPGDSTSSAVTFLFLRRWVHNYPLQEIMDESNHLMRRTLTCAEVLFPYHINAAHAIRETEAGCFGNKQVRIGESQERP
jgi:hypothetical protein